MDKAKCKAIHDEVDKAVQAIAERHGLTLVKSRAAYDSGMARFHFEVCEEGQSTEERDFQTHAHLYGLKPEMLGQTIEVPLNGKVKTFRVVGLNSRSRKFPVIIKGPDGETRKAAAAWVARKFA
jgi:hypothetical protein